MIGPLIHGYSVTRLIRSPFALRTPSEAIAWSFVWVVDALGRLEEGVMIARAVLLWLYLSQIAHVVSQGQPRRRRSLRNPTRLRPATAEGRMSIANMTCDFIEQPLNHFDLPRGRSPSYRERYCVYNEFATDLATAPIFFYTGNESPLPEYINNTGLIWELAPHFGAQVVFAEHRYEGESRPDPSITDCMAYSSSVQALADFANLIETQLFSVNETTQQIIRRPVIAFGGSYGGMLSAWMRMKYPNIVSGVIAGSAPIWGFPRNFPTKIDTAYKIIDKGLRLPYPPDSVTESRENHCSDNLLAAWPLMHILGENKAGRTLLTEAFRLCEPLEDVDLLIEWAQSPWFDLAEGSFPYPSSYVAFALTHKDVKLPAWPLQAACWTESSLHDDLGVVISGNRTSVQYNVTYADSGIAVGVDWDRVIMLPHQVEGALSMSRLDLGDVRSMDSIRVFLENVRDAVSIWYNVTKDVSCYDLVAAPNAEARPNPWQVRASETSRRLSKADQCSDRMDEGSWPALCCNEEMDLILTEASGLGHDAMWPPSHTRGTKSHADVIAQEEVSLDPYCADPDGIFGFPQQDPDPWATFMDVVYGGTSIEAHSNIVFSNGLLDPWSGAGVYAEGMDPTLLQVSDVPGLYIQNINDSVIALLMKYGGYHTDLMYSDPRDPPCITEARKIEAEYIGQWIDAFDAS